MTILMYNIVIETHLAASAFTPHAINNYFCNLKMLNAAAIADYRAAAAPALLLLQSSTTSRPCLLLQRCHALLQHQVLQLQRRHLLLQKHHLLLCGICSKAATETAALYE